MAHMTLIICPPLGHRHSADGRGLLELDAVEAGVPAKVICKTEDYIARQKERIKKAVHFQ